MKSQPRIVTASQMSTYIHYLSEIHDLQLTKLPGGDVYVKAKDMRTEGGKPVQSAVLIWLEARRLIVTRHAKTNGYRLLRPLSDICLTDMISLVKMPDTSPLVKLMKYDPTLTLADLHTTQYPTDQFDYPGSAYSFDFVATLLNVLSHRDICTYPEIELLLGGYRRSYTYTVGVLSTLVKQGLVCSHRKQGYRLCHPFSLVTIKDVIPVVSHRSPVFNKVMYLTQSLPLSLFV